MRLLIFTAWLWLLVPLHAQVAEKRTIETRRHVLDTDGYKMLYPYSETWVRRNLYGFFKTFAQVHIKNNYWLVQIIRDNSEVDYLIQISSIQDPKTLKTEIYVGLLLDAVLVVYHEQYIADSKALLHGFELVVQKQYLSAALTRNEKALQETSEALSRWQKHHNSNQPTPIALEKELMVLQQTRAELMQKISRLYAPPP